MLVDVLVRRSSRRIVVPIDEISSERALRNLRGNKLSVWPDGRTSKGRLGPYTSCDSTATFRFSRDDLIFTVGSCFAREIEKTLTALDFTLPTTRLQTPADERASAVPNEILNKYTTSAVVNELRWGLGLEAFPEDGFLPVRDGLVHDPHLNPSTPPVTIERAVQRRKKIHELVATLPSCRIVILTLGLVETWFDKKTELFLNGTPPRPAMTAEPDRFTLHRQSYADIRADLETIHQLLTDHGHPNFKMLISVSPVPFKATFSGQDAIRANTYSKSVLRAAAEEFWASHDNVDYFPSYEMVTLSDRNNAYLDDQIHVNPSMVSRIMGFALSKYVEGFVAQSDDHGAQAFEGGPAQLWAESVRLRQEGQFDLAVRVLRNIEDRFGVRKTGKSPADFNLILGMNLISAGRLTEAEPYLARAVALAPDNARSCYTLGVVNARLRRPEARVYLERAVRLEPASVDFVCRLALQYEREKDPKRALTTYHSALALDPASDVARLAIARLGDPASTEFQPA
jgi:hypothetical protein